MELDRFGEACAFTGLQHLGALEAAHLCLSSQNPEHGIKGKGGGNFRRIAAGQAGDLLGESDLRAGRGSAPEPEPPDGQADQHFLADCGGIEQPPLIPAMHPPGHRPALRAPGRRTARPGLDTDRPARHEHPLYQHIFQMRQQDISNIKKAWPA